MTTIHTKSAARYVAALAVISLALGGAKLASGQSADPAACLDCHEDAAASLAIGPHGVEAGTELGCLACHAGEAAHYEDDPAVYPMNIPGTGGVQATATLCAACHENAHQTRQATLSAHATAEVTCLDCHGIHSGTTDGQLHQAQPGLCYTCHADQRGDFALPYHHPANAGEAMTCSDCHLTSDDAMAPLAMQGGNAVCLECHRAFQGPFPYEHEATVDYSTEEGGCVNCHDPHGSYLPRLLLQPYEAPHNQLCSQCHLVPLHEFNSHHGDAWAGVACNECHMDIHGSYTNRLFMSPALEAQGCFVVGCHSR